MFIASFFSQKCSGSRQPDRFFRREAEKVLRVYGYYVSQAVCLNLPGCAIKPFVSTSETVIMWRMAAASWCIFSFCKIGWRVYLRSRITGRLRACLKNGDLRVGKNLKNNKPGFLSIVSDRVVKGLLIRSTTHSTNYDVDLKN
jgi:hypothetical protein